MTVTVIFLLHSIYNISIKYARVPPAQKRVAKRNKPAETVAEADVAPTSRPGRGGKDDSALKSKSGAGLVALLLADCWSGLGPFAPARP